MKQVLRLLGFVVLSVLFFHLWIGEASAHCGMCGMGEEDKVEAVTKASPVTLKAKVICLGCSLKKEQGANAQCSVYGHQHALKTEDGKIWTILENDISTELINSHEYAGKEIEIAGKIFGSTQIIEIESFKLVEE